MRCWGLNDDGRLGDGTTTSPRLNGVTPFVSRPVLINGVWLNLGGPLSDVVGISAGDKHTCARQASGAINCWGTNSSGQVGDGTAAGPRVTPLEVASFRFNVDPSVAIDLRGRVATVTALLNCSTGQEAEVSVILRQGAVEGRVNRRVRCETGLQRVPIDLVAMPRSNFVSGSAVVDADISVSDRGQPLDAQHWKRSVQLQVVACQPRAEGDFARPIDDHDDGGDRRCDE